MSFLLVGLLRGRKHGMSEELTGLIKWLVIVMVCTCAYEPAGQWFATDNRHESSGRFPGWCHGSSRKVGAALDALAAYIGIDGRRPSPRGVIGCVSRGRGTRAAR